MYYKKAPQNRERGHEKKIGGKIQGKQNDNG